MEIMLEQKLGVDTAEIQKSLNKGANIFVLQSHQKAVNAELNRLYKIREAEPVKYQQAYMQKAIELLGLRDNLAFAIRMIKRAGKGK